VECLITIPLVFFVTIISLIEMVPVAMVRGSFEAQVSGAITPPPL
jgi:hypothetical protein